MDNSYNDIRSCERLGEFAALVVEFVVVGVLGENLLLQKYRQIYKPRRTRKVYLQLLNGHRRSGRLRSGRSGGLW